MTEIVYMEASTFLEQRAQGSPIRKITDFWGPRGSHVLVEHGKETDPFSLVVFDFDGTVVQSDVYYRYCWKKLFREKGITGDDDSLLTLRDSVYGWEGDMTSSMISMVQKIQKRQSRNSQIIKDSDWELLEKFVGHTSDPIEVIAEKLIIAKEQIGVSALEKDPSLVERLAPLADGIEKFLTVIPESVSVAVMSASSRRNIMPILEAHLRVNPKSQLGRFSELDVFGEEDAKGNRKPNAFFFAHLVAAHTRINPSKRAGEVSNIVFFGDNAHADIMLGGLNTRTHSVVIVNPDPNLQMVRLTPIDRVVPNFDELLRQIKKPESTSIVLQRLNKTLVV
ncbi:MAG: hypothetical protein AAB508_02575 [Patescibacteria group bacterium]